MNNRCCGLYTGWVIAQQLRYSNIHKSIHTMTTFCLILCTAEVRSWISIPNRRVPTPMNVGRPTCRYRRHVTVINFIIKRKEKEKKHVFTQEKCYIIKGMLRCLATAPKLRERQLWLCSRPGCIPARMATNS